MADTRFQYALLTLAVVCTRVSCRRVPAMSRSMRLVATCWRALSMAMSRMRGCETFTDRRSVVGAAAGTTGAWPDTMAPSIIAIVVIEIVLRMMTFPALGGNLHEIAFVAGRFARQRRRGSVVGPRHQHINRRHDKQR